jgi:RNA polymerase sigma factor (sigma-70 family)
LVGGFPEPRGAAQDPTSANGLGIDRELWDLVRALPRKQRGAVALRFVAGLSHAEVAEALGSSEEAARQSLYAGLNKLRKEWTG